MRVLVAVDKSEEAERALRYSCELLAGTSAWVLALHVKPDEETITPQHFLYPTMDRIDIIERIDSDADQVKEVAMERCDSCSPGKVPCWARVVAGEPAEEILEAADMGQYDLIVLGAHGRSALAGLFLGTIHSKILHLTHHPVLFVRELRPLRRVLVAYRGTRCDQRALDFISTLFSARKPEITIVHVQEADRDETRLLAEACLSRGHRVLEKAGYRVEAKMLQGGFVQEVREEAATDRYDLIVLGAYDHKRPKILSVIGDDALDLVRRTSLPVLVFRDDHPPWS